MAVTIDNHAFFLTRFVQCATDDGMAPVSSVASRGLTRMVAAIADATIRKPAIRANAHAKLPVKSLINRKLPSTPIRCTRPSATRSFEDCRDDLHVT